MMDLHASSDLPEPLFRPVKKRKFLRRRADTDAEDLQLDTPAERSPPNHHSSNANNATQPTGVNHIRRTQRTRKGGIEFSASSRHGGNEPQPAIGPSAADLEGDGIQRMCDRFTGHTGQAVDVDKHMYAFLTLRC